MKLHLAALALLPLLAAAAPVRAVNAPDLRIVDVTSPNLDRGIVRVQVNNKGNADAPPCLVTVTLTGLQTGATTVTMQPVKAGWTVFVNVQTNHSLSQLHYTVRVDRANTIAEPDEANNIMSGQFGGKP